MSDVEDDLTGRTRAQAILAGAADELGEGPPDRIGPYDVERLIGVGGMGRVYLARRVGEGFEKRVAIKVLRLGVDDPETLARFKAERRLLGQLEHPGIAALLDGGTTDSGTPYLVMEYVEGRTLFADAEARALGVRGRLDVFLAVCDAVGALHRSLVVHRDIKPSNIVVGASGAPKLLDFGIAKLLEPTESDRTMVLTRDGAALFTPQYASPEQVAGGPLTTASDIYALGRLLFEYLSGAQPYEFTTQSAAEIERVVTGVEPPPMSSVTTLGNGRELRGDLDRIVAKAMRKDPDRRYATVDRLAEDLRRYLAGLPVAAQGDSRLYRLSKFVKRRRGLVTSVAAGLFALVGFALTTVLKNAAIARERDRAQESAATSEEVTRFLVDLFRVAEPGEFSGDALTARAILVRGASTARSMLDTGPRVRGEVLQAMGSAFLALGDADRAEEVLAEADALRQGDDERPVARARTWASLASLAAFRGDFKAARAGLERAIDEVDAAKEARPIDRASMRATLAEIEAIDGDFEGALAHCEEALTVLGQRTSLAERRFAAGVERNLAGHLEALGRLDEAEARLASVLDEEARLYDGAHPDLAFTLVVLANVLRSQGRAQDALARAREADTIEREVLGEEHPDRDRTRFLIAGLLRDVGELQASLELYREILEREERRYGDHIYVALDHGDVAGILMALDRLDEARAHYDTSLAMLRRVLAADHHEIATALSNLGALERGARNYGRSEELLRQALAIRLKTFPPDHTAVLTTRNTLALVLDDQGRTEDALVEAEAVLEARRAAFGDHSVVATSLFATGALHLKLGRTDLGRSRLAAAVELYRATAGPDHIDVARPAVYLARHLLESGEEAAAQPYIEDALRIRRLRLPPEHPGIAEALALTEKLDPR